MSAGRVIAWRHAEHRAVCDRIEPWEHGTAAWAGAFPGYWSFNALRLEHGEPDAETLLAAAERLHPADLLHRKVDVEDEALGERLRPAFSELGWRTNRLVYMALEGEPDAPGSAPVELRDTTLGDVRGLRIDWATGHQPADQVLAHLPTEETVAGLLGARVIAAVQDGRDVGFCEWRAEGDCGEVQLAYVSPEHRGRGIGGALVAAAVRRAREAGASLVLIAADDEERAKDLYARLGFRPVLTIYELVRMPTAASP